MSLERLAMKTKHTPEPWKWDESWGAIVVDRPDMQKLICPMWTGCDRARMGRDVVDEDLANAARIVACVNACDGINPGAVPDLLAIVRAEYDEHDGFRTLPMGYPADRAAAICAAITKAEGGAH